MRVAIPAALGLAILGAGEWFSRKKYIALARTATGGGLTALYFSVFSGWALGEAPVIPATVVWPAMAAITAVAIALAVRYSSLTIAILSLAGGLTAPLLIRTGEDPGHVLFLYDIAVSAGVLVLAYFKKWRVLNVLAMAGTVLSTGTWLWQFYWQAGSPAEKLPMILVYFSILWFLYFLVMVVYHLLGGRGESRLDLPVSIVNVAWYFGVLYEVLRHEHHVWLGPVAGGLGLVYLAQVLAMRRWAPDQRRLLLLQAGQALALLTLAIPIHFDGIYIPMAWAVWAAVLFALGARWADWRLRIIGLAVHVASLAALGYYAGEAWDAKGMILLNSRTMTFALVAGALAVSAILYRRSPQRNRIEDIVMTVATGIAHVTFMTLLVVEVQKWFTVATAGLTTPAEIRPLRTLHDTLLVVGFAAYGAAAVALAAVVRRVFHHGIALLAFAASMFLLVYGYAMGRLPPLEGTPGLNGVGGTFGALVAGLAVAAVLSRYAMRDLAGRRPLAIAYELLAVAVGLGLYLVEVSRWDDRQAALGDLVPAATLLALCSGGLAVFGLALLARAAWITSLAHRISSLLCTAASWRCWPTPAWARPTSTTTCSGTRGAWRSSSWPWRWPARPPWPATAAGPRVWRVWFIPYELGAWAAVLGLYLTELLQFAAHHTDLPTTTVLAFAAVACAVYAAALVARAAWIGSIAHRASSLLCAAAAVVLLGARLRTRGPRLRRHGLEPAMPGPRRPGPGHGRFGRRGPLRPRGRGLAGWFIAYELAAWAVVLGLYLTELFQFAAHHKDLPSTSVIALAGAACAVYVARCWPARRGSAATRTSWPPSSAWSPRSSCWRRPRSSCRTPTR